MRLTSRLFLSALGMGAVLLTPSAQADLPMSTFPDCGATPNHGGVGCPSDFGEKWNMIHYVKDDYIANVREEEWSMGSGMHVDRAFAIEVGDWSTTVAIFDSGIEWDQGDTPRKWRLNFGELPLPQLADGSTATSHDVNGDGLVNITDYENDSRVDISNGLDHADHMLDPSDLIYTFSDGIDDDGNGYTDDICGWDFLWNDNDAFDQSQNQGYSHGTLQARDSVGEGNDGGRIGTCPNCSAIPLRVGTSFMTNSTAFSHAMIYAVDNDVQVIQAAAASLDSSMMMQDTIDYAWENNVLFMASAADETSIHSNFPGANHHSIVVAPTTYTGSEEGDSESFVGYHNCSNFGGRRTFSIAVNGCSSEATSLSAGLAGLLQSANLHANRSLSTNEMYQILVGTVDDIYVPEANTSRHPYWYPSLPGWDRYFGYGRPNIRAAIDRVYAGAIPPEVDLTEPRWFEVLDPEETPIVDVYGLVQANRANSFTYIVEYAVGLDPMIFTRIAMEQSTGSIEGKLASWDISAIPLEDLDPSANIEPFTTDDDPVSRVNKINRYTVTLRVRVIDDNQRESEMRKTLYIQHDPDSVAAFPRYLGSSLEASPKLYDLDGDGTDEIIQTTTAGEVHAYRYDGTEMEGWPVQVGVQRMLSSDYAGNHLQSAAFQNGALASDYRQLILGAAAIGDLDSDGDPEVVAATEEGFVYAWHHDGSLLNGFPVEIDRSRATGISSDENHIWEDGIFSAPVLGDLTGDGDLEIVVGAMDQNVYAWTFAGNLAPGWPVTLGYPDRATVLIEGRVMVTPAIGDVNQDGLADVVVGTNEQIDYLWSPTYLIHGDGNLHLGGPYHRGWPIKTMGLYAALLPDVGTGTTASPALADLNGDGVLEIAAHTVLSFDSGRSGTFYNADGSVYGDLHEFSQSFGAMNNINEAGVIPLVNSGGFGDIDQDGDLDYAIGTAGLGLLKSFVKSNKIVNSTFQTTAWDANSGDMLPGFPQQVSDMQLLGHLSIADISGDGMPEVMSGTGAFTVHAFDAYGEQPEGWPKFTGQWIIGTPAVGDLDGDGMLEVVVGTRSGWLYAWHTNGLTPENGGVVEWASYHNDAANTGVYGTLDHQKSSENRDFKTPMGNKRP